LASGRTAGAALNSCAAAGPPAAPPSRHLGLGRGRHQLVVRPVAAVRLVAAVRVAAGPGPPCCAASCGRREVGASDAHVELALVDADVREVNVPHAVAQVTEVRLVRVALERAHGEARERRQEHLHRLVRERGEDVRVRVRRHGQRQLLE